MFRLGPAVAPQGADGEIEVGAALWFHNIVEYLLA
jgi:hypothetical protein